MISYEPLTSLLNERGITFKELIEVGGFSSTTLAKINKNESITMETLDRLCIMLGVPVEKVIEIVGHDISKQPNIGGSTIKKAVGNTSVTKLKAIRRTRGLTQGELADILGVYQSQISLWERDGIDLSDEHINILKSKLNVTDEEL